MNLTQFKRISRFTHVIGLRIYDFLQVTRDIQLIIEGRIPHVVWYSNMRCKWVCEDPLPTVNGYWRTDETN